MIRRSMRGAAVAAALIAGGCQTGFYGSSTSPPTAAAPSAMDGTWASTDGVFIANFEGGRFTSHFTKTNEILAQGTYGVAGSTVTLNWISVKTKQQRAATCTFSAADTVACDQQGGGKFQLRRGGDIPMTASG
jgi:hypothetical protein